MYSQCIHFVWPKLLAQHTVWSDLNLPSPVPTNLAVRSPPPPRSRAVLSFFAAHKNGEINRKRPETYESELNEHKHKIEPKNGTELNEKIYIDFIDVETVIGIGIEIKNRIKKTEIKNRNRNRNQR